MAYNQVSKTRETSTSSKKVSEIYNLKLLFFDPRENTHNNIQVIQCEG